jgi:hypothetical protein
MQRLTTKGAPPLPMPLPGATVCDNLWQVCLPTAKCRLKTISPDSPLMAAGPCYIASGWTAQRTPFLAPAMLQSHAATAANCTENTASNSTSTTMWHHCCHEDVFIAPLHRNVPWLSVNMSQYQCTWENPVSTRKMQKADTAIRSITQVSLSWYTTQELLMLISFRMALTVSAFAETFPLNSRTSWCTLLFYSTKVSILV